jgi:hypothetical protein
MSLNRRGIRDICRVLKLSNRTVIQLLKRQAARIKQVNKLRLKQLTPQTVEVEIVRALEIVIAKDEVGFLKLKPT